MGCDIHGRVQVNRWGAEWQDHGEIPDCRNYALFGALANVRQYSPDASDYIAEPRGLPADVDMDPDDETAIMVESSEYWVGDMPAKLRYWIGDHSYSWLTLDEVLAWDGWDRSWGESTLRDRCDYFLIFCQYLKARWGSTPVRFVFGFDN